MESDKKLSEKLGTIRDWWIGDNTDWQDKLDYKEKTIVDFIRNHIFTLFQALDHYSIEEQSLNDKIKYLEQELETARKLGRDK